MNPHDLRYKKAEVVIVDTFIEYIKSTEFEKVTVKEIIERAQINRSTFYAHYSDKYELLDRIENDLLKNLVEVINQVPIDQAIKDESSMEGAMLSYAKSITDFLHSNGKQFTLLLGDNGRSEFTVKFNRLIQETWVKKNLTERLTIPSNYAYAVFSGLITNLITEWVKSGFKESDEEFIQIAMQVTRDMPSKLFKKQEMDITGKM
ncbi:MAG: hypothetical protein CL609_10520 [Anaerolineaceae bacterium]|nr:hypothetical protein [Anaerolineaceae bacterium]